MTIPLRAVYVPRMHSPGAAPLMFGLTGLRETGRAVHEFHGDVGGEPGPLREPDPASPELAEAQLGVQTERGGVGVLDVPEDILLILLGRQQIAQEPGGDAAALEPGRGGDETDLGEAGPRAVVGPRN